MEMITRLQIAKCRHNKFIVDETMGDVICGICEERLNPIWCLVQISKTESRMWSNLIDLEKLVYKTRDKLRCKCQKCGEMTRIIR